MAADDTFRSVRSEASGLYKEKGSRFISIIYPVSSEAEIKEILENVRKEYHDARHHCYAYILGANQEAWRANDDGEPSGTAGKPILGQIRSAGLTNVIIVVIRYFGGTLLGVSGLINAYRTAAASAISNAEILVNIIHETLELNFPYTAMNDVMKMLKEENIIQSQHSFDLQCNMTISFRSSARERITSRLERIEGLTYKTAGSAPVPGQD